MSSTATNADESLLFKLRGILEDEGVVELYYNAASGLMIWNSNSTNTGIAGHRYERRGRYFPIKGEVPQKHG